MRIGFQRSIAIVAMLVSLLVVRIDTVGAAPSPESPPTSRFVPTSPGRVLDTRTSGGVVAPGGHVDVLLAGTGSIPPEATAVVLNVTLVEATGPGFVEVFPTGRTTVGNASNLNANHAGQTVATLVVVPIGQGGAVSLYTEGGGDLLADLLGWFVPARTGSAGRYVAVTANRMLDTRMQTPGKLDADGSVRVPITGRAGVPAVGVGAVIANVTATDATATGYLEVLPTGAGVPVGSSSNVNVVAGETAPNLVIVPVGADGSISVYSSAGAHVIVDVFGYFTDASAAPSADGLFVPLEPARLLDSRTGAKPAGAAVVPVAVLDRLGLPAQGVGALMATLTATQAEGDGFVQIMPGPRATAPIGLYSNVNTSGPDQTVANAALVSVGRDGTVLVYTSTPTHLLLDVAGWFTGPSANPPVPNHPPSAPRVERTVAAGSETDLDLAAAATDPDGDALTVTAVGPPTAGRVQTLSSGVVRFIAPSDVSTTVDIPYTIDDGRGGSSSNLITLHVVRLGTPLAPTDLRGEAVAWDNSASPTRGTIRLVWLDRADNETGYRVTETLDAYCAGTNNLHAENVIGEFGPNTEEAVVPVIDVSSRRCFASITVAAFNRDGVGPASAPYTVQPPRANAPVITEFTKLTESTYRLVWTQEPALGGYRTNIFAFGNLTHGWTPVGSLDYARVGNIYTATLTTSDTARLPCGSVLAQNDTYATQTSYDPTYDAVSSNGCPGIDG